MVVPTIECNNNRSMICCGEPTLDSEYDVCCRGMMCLLSRLSKLCFYCTGVPKRTLPNIFQTSDRNE